MSQYQNYDSNNYTHNQNIQYNQSDTQYKGVNDISVPINNPQYRMNYHMQSNVSPDSYNNGYFDSPSQIAENYPRDYKGNGYYNSDNAMPNSNYNNLSNYAIDDYEELKQAYLNQLTQMNSVKNDNSLDYKYAPMDTMDMNKINRENFESNYNTGNTYRDRDGYGNSYQRPGINAPNQIYYNTHNDSYLPERSNAPITFSASPNETKQKISEKHLDKEIKRKQQEEYRNFLDLQLREQNEKRERIKLEKRGIKTENNNFEINQNEIKGKVNNVAEKANVNTNKNSNVLPSNLKNQNIHLNHNSANYNYDGNIYNSPVNNSNYVPITNLPNNSLPSNGSNTRTNSATSTLDIEKKKKLEYQNVLKQQIEDNKSRKEQEKRKQKEQDMIFSQKYEKDEYADNIKGRKRVLESKQEENLNKNIQQDNNSKISTQNMNNNNLGTNAHNINQINNVSNITNDKDLIKNFPSNQNYIPHEKNSNYNIPQPSASLQKNSENFHFRNNKDINTFNEDNLHLRERELAEQHYLRNIIESQNLIKNNQLGNYMPNQMLTHNPNTIYQIPLTSNLGTNNFHYPPNYTNNLLNSYHYSSIPPQYTNSVNTINTNSAVSPPHIEEMLRFFFQQQVIIINQYKSVLEKLSEEKDKKIFCSNAVREKTIAMNLLKLEQERFKSNVGFYPFDNNYNSNMEDIFSTMIEHKVNKSDYGNNNLHKRSSNDHKGKHINSNSYSNSNTHLTGNQYEETFINTIPIVKKEREDVHYIDFKSKYEDLTQSMISINFAKEKDETNLKSSLEGFSKLVNVNPAATHHEEEFLVTWREEEIESEINEEDFNQNKNIYRDSINQKLTNTNILHSRTTSDLFKDKQIMRDIVNNIDDGINTYTYNIPNEFNESFSGAADMHKNITNVKETDTSFTRHDNLVKAQMLISYTRNPNLEKIKISREEKDKSIIYNSAEEDLNDISSRILNTQLNINKIAVNSLSRNTYNTEGDRDKRITSSFNNNNYNRPNYSNEAAHNIDTDSENSVIELNEDEVDYNHNEKYFNKEHHSNLNDNLQVNFEEDNAKFCNPEYNLNQSGDSQGSGDQLYSQSFNNQEELEQLESIEVGDKVEEINLEDYKEIHEKEKFESQVNFFENSRDNYEMVSRLHRNHIVNITGKSEANSNPNYNPNMDSNQAILQQDIRPSIHDPKERIARNITSLNRNKINCLYDKYNQLKNKGEAKTPKNNETSQFMDSLNNFNENYDRIRSKINGQYNQEESGKSSIFAENITPEKKIKVGTNKYSDLNRGDSLLEDLTKFTKFALNEVNQSEMSILKSKDDRVNNSKMTSDSIKFGNKYESGFDKYKNGDADLVSIDVVNEYRQKKKRPGEI